jgi:DME family drug/metabolite transporter
MDAPSARNSSLPSLSQGRLCILLAAILWSLSGGFSKVLTKDTGLGLNHPEVQAFTIAFYRALFAGVVLLPALRVQDLSFRWMMGVMVACFAAMNVTFVTALTAGSAANAILLQYTGPMWMYLVSVRWLGEPPDRRSFYGLAVGLIGILVIVGGESQSDQLPIVLIGLGSGLAYAGVILCIRILREASSRWLTILNHLISALVLLPVIWTLASPTLPQFVCLFLFGALQMGLPYWLVARGLRVVSPQEAGMITLLEPLLNPLWAYLVAREVPKLPTFIGGALILGALAWRYWPFRKTWGS